MIEAAERRFGILSRLGRTANALGLLIPVVVLIGWVIGSDGLTRFFPGVIQMNPLTALCFLAGGVALWRYGNDGQPTGRDGVPRVLGALVGLVGLVVLAQFALGIRDGIDRVLFRESLGVNAMALNSALCMVLLGAGLATLRSWTVLAEAALTTLLLVALLALCGYVYEVGLLYQVGQRTAMAPHTALCFTFLGSGALLTHARHGVAGRLASDGPGGRIARTLLPAILVFPFVAGWGLLTGARGDLYDMAAGFALFTILVTGAMSALLWRQAGILDRHEAEERRLEAAATQARDEAQAANERFKHAFDLSAIGKALVGSDGSWLQVNPAICAIVGYTEPELLQITFQDITHPDDVGEDVGLLNQILRGEIESYQMEKRYFHKQGHIVWVLLSVTAVRSPSGAFLYFLSEIQDITGLKAATAALEQARDAAQSADRAKSQFLAVMSHEIRTPLNSVLGFGELLLDTPLDEEQRAFVGYINSGGEGLLRLINDILDLSKIEAGGVELEQRPFDLRALLEAIAQTFQPRASAKGLVLRTHVDDAVPLRVMGDEHRIRQMLANYLSNALKFTESGSVEVSVRAERPAGRASEVLIQFSVRDTGAGIAHDRMDRLFKTFSQVDASTTRKYGGTGLGLAIVRRLAEMMGGQAWAESVAGEGSTFYVTVRLGASVPDAASPQVRGHPALQVPPGLRILLADDIESNQNLVMVTLARLGLQADVVSDGAQAVGAVAEAASAGRPYDVVLMDVQMPVMDGIVATRAIRAALPMEQQPRIVAITADALVGDRERCLRAGMDDYLSKPFRLDAFADALIRSRRPASPPPDNLPSQK